MPDVAGSLWTHFHAHPDVLIGLALLQGGYLLGVGPIRERFNLADSVDARQVATFTAGVLPILVALLSPIPELSDHYLFSAHLVQHVLLTLVAPPLLILGAPDWLIRPILRPDWAFRLVRYGTHPVVAFALFNVIFSMWHIPSLYHVSVTNHGVHILEHIVFIAAAVLMWWPLASNMPELPRLSHPHQIGYLFVLSIAQLILFAPITFAREPIYQHYVDAPRIFGMSAVIDQQVGAIFMKIGGGGLFMTLLIVAFFRWFKAENSQEQADPAAAQKEYTYPSDSPELEENLS